MQKETKKGETEEHFRNTRNSADRFLQIRINLAKLLKGVTYNARERIFASCAKTIL